MESFLFDRIIEADLSTHMLNHDCGTWYSQPNLENWSRNIEMQRELFP